MVLEIIGFCLFFIVLVGVVIMITELFNKLVEQNYAKKKIGTLEKQLEDFKNDSKSKLEVYEDTIKKMANDIVNYKMETDRIVIANNKCVDDICNISNKIIDMNSTFYLKVELLEKALSQEGGSDEVQRLISLINKDIHSLAEFQLEMARYKQQRDLALENELKAKNKHRIDRGYER